MLTEQEEKTILENLDVLTEAFRLLSERENSIISGNIEEDERLYAIKEIRRTILRWCRERRLTVGDERLIVEYFGIFLEALYIFRRDRKASKKKILNLEEVFERMIPSKIKEATMGH
jgi:hypothetical protein